MNCCHKLVKLVLVNLKNSIFFISRDQKIITSLIVLIIGASLGTMKHDDVELSGFKNSTF